VKIPQPRKLKMIKNFGKLLRPMLRKGTAVFVCAAFLATSVYMPQASAEISPVPAVAYRSLADDLNAIAIPKEIGKVQETYRGTSDKIVVLIQDAHSIPDAQRSIRSVIDHFQNKYGVSLVGLEGASETLDPQIFKSFPDKDQLRKTFDIYAERGELTGGTAAAIFSGSQAEAGSRKAEGGNPQASTFNLRPVFHGIEDWSLYEEGVSYFLKAMAMEKEIKALLDPEVAALTREKEAVYSKELLEIDRMLAGFGENQTDLIQVLKQLSQYQLPPQGSELAVLLEEIKTDLRPETGDQSLQIEIKNIADQVRKALTSRHSEPAAGGGRIPKEGSFTDAQDDLLVFNQKFQEFKTSETTPHSFALYLKGLVKKLKIRVKVSRALASCVENQRRLKDIEGTRLFEDFKRYGESVMESLIQNIDKTPSPLSSPPGRGQGEGEFDSSDRVKTIRLLDQQTKEFDLLKRLARLELSFKDWTTLKQTMVDRPQTEESKRVAEDRKASLSFPHALGGNPGIGLTPGSPTNTFGDDNLKPWIAPELRAKLEAHIRFYHVAEQRDEVFFKNMSTLMAKNESRGTSPESRATSTALLVAGGFHTQGLTQTFKEKGISYVLVMPRIGSFPEAPLYREHMQGQVSWSNYFEVENGQVNLYDAFVRATRDRLLSPQSIDHRPQTNTEDSNRGPWTMDRGPTPKEWRDQIIRDLAAEGRITEAGDYTRFIDELGGQRAPSHAQRLKKAWLANIDRFGEGLKKLQTEGNLNESSILQLIKTITIPAEVSANALAVKTRAEIRLLPWMKSLGLATALPPPSGAPIVEPPTSAKPRAEVRSASRIKNDAGIDSAMAPSRSESWKRRTLAGLRRGAAVVLVAGLGLFFAGYLVYRHFDYFSFERATGFSESNRLPHVQRTSAAFPEEFRWFDRFSALKGSEVYDSLSAVVFDPDDLVPRLQQLNDLKKAGVRQIPLEAAEDVVKIRQIPQEYVAWIKGASQRYGLPPELLLAHMISAPINGYSVDHGLRILGKRSLAARTVASALSRGLPQWALGLELNGKAVDLIGLALNGKNSVGVFQIRPVTVRRYLETLDGKMVDKMNDGEISRVLLNPGVNIKAYAAIFDAVILEVETFRKDAAAGQAPDMTRFPEGAAERDLYRIMKPSIENLSHVPPLEIMGPYGWLLAIYHPAESLKFRPDLKLMGLVLLSGVLDGRPAEFSVGTPADRAIVIKLLKNNDPYIREAAARTLANNKNRSESRSEEKAGGLNPSLLLPGAVWSDTDKEKFNAALLAQMREKLDEISRDTQKQYRDYAGPVYDALAFSTNSVSEGLQRVMERMFGIEDLGIFLIRTDRSRPVQMSDYGDILKYGRGEILAYGVRVFRLSRNAEDKFIKIFILNVSGAELIRKNILSDIAASSWAMEQVNARISSVGQPSFPAARSEARARSESRTEDGIEATVDAAVRAGTVIYQPSVRRSEARTEQSGVQSESQIEDQGLSGGSVPQRLASQENITPSVRVSDTQPDFDGQRIWRNKDWRVSFGPKITYMNMGSSNLRDMVAVARELFKRMPTERFLQILRKISRDESLSLEDLTGGVVIQYHAEGSHKVVFKVTIAKRKGGDIQLTWAAKLKRNDGASEISERELADLKKLNGRGVPIFGGEGVTQDGRIWFVEEFIEGSQATELRDAGRMLRSQGLKKEGQVNLKEKAARNLPRNNPERERLENEVHQERLEAAKLKAEGETLGTKKLTIEMRKSIVSSLIDFALGAGGQVPSDIHGDNFIIRRGPGEAMSGQAVLVDPGNPRLVLWGEGHNEYYHRWDRMYFLAILMANYGFDHGEGDDSYFFDAVMEKLGKDEGAWFLREAYAEAISLGEGHAASLRSKHAEALAAGKGTRAELIEQDFERVSRMDSKDVTRKALASYLGSSKRHPMFKVITRKGYGSEFHSACKIFSDNFFTLLENYLKGIPAGIHAETPGMPGSSSWKTPNGSDARSESRVGPEPAVERDATFAASKPEGPRPADPESANIITVERGTRAETLLKIASVALKVAMAGTAVGMLIAFFSKSWILGGVLYGALALSWFGHAIVEENRALMWENKVSEMVYEHLKDLLAVRRDIPDFAFPEDFSAKDLALIDRLVSRAEDSHEMKALIGGAKPAVEVTMWVPGAFVSYQDTLAKLGLKVTEHPFMTRENDERFSVVIYRPAAVQGVFEQNRAYIEKILAGLRIQIPENADGIVEFLMENAKKSSLTGLLYGYPRSAVEEYIEIHLHKRFLAGRFVKYNPQLDRLLRDLDAEKPPAEKMNIENHTGVKAYSLKSILDLLFMGARFAAAEEAFDTAMVKANQLVTRPNTDMQSRVGEAASDIRRIDIRAETRSELRAEPVGEYGTAEYDGNNRITKLTTSDGRVLIERKYTVTPDNETVAETAYSYNPDGALAGTSRATYQTVDGVRRGLTVDIEEKQKERRPMIDRRMIDPSRVKVLRGEQEVARRNVAGQEKYDTVERALNRLKEHRATQSMMRLLDQQNLTDLQRFLEYFFFSRTGMEAQIITLLSKNQEIDPSMALFLLKARALTGDDAARSELMGWLNEPDGLKRYLARSYVYLSGQKEGLELVFQSAREGHFTSIVADGLTEQEIAVLAEEVISGCQKDPSSYSRMFGFLERINDSRVTDMVAAFLSRYLTAGGKKYDGFFDVQNSMRYLDDHKAIQHRGLLRALMKQENNELANAAILTLARMGDREIIPDLIDRINATFRSQGENDYELDDLIEVLESLNAVEALPLFLKILKALRNPKRESLFGDSLVLNAIISAIVKIGKEKETRTKILPFLEAVIPAMDALTAETDTGDVYDMYPGYYAMRIIAALQDYSGTWVLPYLQKLAGKCTNPKLINAIDLAIQTIRARGNFDIERDGPDAFETNIGHLASVLDIMGSGRSKDGTALSISRYYAKKLQDKPALRERLIDIILRDTPQKGAAMRFVALFPEDVKKLFSAVPAAQHPALKAALLEAILENHMNAIISNYSDRYLAYENLISLKEKGVVFGEIDTAFLIKEFLSFGIVMDQTEIGTLIEGSPYFRLAGSVVFPKLEIMNVSYRGSRAKEAEDARYSTKAITVGLRYRGGERGEATGIPSLYEWDIQLMDGASDFWRTPDPNVALAFYYRNPDIKTISPAERLLASFFGAGETVARPPQEVRKRAVSLINKFDFEAVKELIAQQESERVYKKAFFDLLENFRSAKTAKEALKLFGKSDADPNTLRGVVKNLKTQTGLLPDYAERVYGEEKGSFDRIKKTITELLKAGDLKKAKASLNRSFTVRFLESEKRRITGTIEDPAFSPSGRPAGGVAPDPVTSVRSELRNNALYLGMGGIFSVSVLMMAVVASLNLSSLLFLSFGLTAIVSAGVALGVFFSGLQPSADLVPNRVLNVAGAPRVKPQVRGPSGRAAVWSEAIERNRQTTAIIASLQQRSIASPQEELYENYDADPAFLAFQKMRLLGHGCRAGLDNFLSIILSGIVAPGRSGMPDMGRFSPAKERQGNPFPVVDSYGPFFVTLYGDWIDANEKIMENGLRAHLHNAYVVPDLSVKAYILDFLDTAVRMGYLDAQAAERRKNKVLTYEEAVKAGTVTYQPSAQRTEARFNQKARSEVRADLQEPSAGPTIPWYRNPFGWAVLTIENNSRAKSIKAVKDLLGPEISDAIYKAEPNDPEVLFALMAAVKNRQPFITQIRSFVERGDRGARIKALINILNSKDRARMIEKFNSFTPPLELSAGELDQLLLGLSEGVSDQSPQEVFSPERMDHIRRFGSEELKPYRSISPRLIYHYVNAGNAGRFGENILDPIRAMLDQTQVGVTAAWVNESLIAKILEAADSAEDAGAVFESYEYVKKYAAPQDNERIFSEILACPGGAVRAAEAINRCQKTLGFDGFQDGKTILGFLFNGKGDLLIKTSFLFAVMAKMSSAGMKGTLFRKAIAGTLYSYWDFDFYSEERKQTYLENMGKWIDRLEIPALIQWGIPSDLINEAWADAFAGEPSKFHSTLVSLAKSGKITNGAKLVELIKAGDSSYWRLEVLEAAKRALQTMSEEEFFDFFKPVLYGGKNANEFIRRMLPIAVSGKIKNGARFSQLMYERLPSGSSSKDMDALNEAFYSIEAALDQEAVLPLLEDFMSAGVFSGHLRAVLAFVSKAKDPVKAAANALAYFKAVDRGLKIQGKAGDIFVNYVQRPDAEATLEVLTEKMKRFYGMLQLESKEPDSMESILDRIKDREDILAWLDAAVDLLNISKDKVSGIDDFTLMYAFARDYQPEASVKSLVELTERLARLGMSERERSDLAVRLLARMSIGTGFRSIISLVDALQTNEFDAASAREVLEELARERDPEGIAQGLSRVVENAKDKTRGAGKTDRLKNLLLSILAAPLYNHQDASREDFANSVADSGKVDELSELVSSYIEYIRASAKESVPFETARHLCGNLIKRLAQSKEHDALSFGQVVMSFFENSNSLKYFASEQPDQLPPGFHKFLKLVPDLLGCSAAELSQAVKMAMEERPSAWTTQAADVIAYLSLVRNPRSTEVIDALRPYGYMVSKNHVPLLLELANDPQKLSDVLRSLEEIRTVFPDFEYGMYVQLWHSSRYDSDPYKVLLGQTSSNMLYERLKKSEAENAAVFQALASTLFDSLVDKSIADKEAQKGLFRKALQELLAKAQDPKYEKSLALIALFQDPDFLRVLALRPWDAERLLGLVRYNDLFVKAQIPVETFARVKMLHDMGAQDPIDAFEKIMDQLGRAFNVNRIFETARQLFPESDAANVGVKFDADVFIQFVEGVGLYSTPTIYKIFDSLAKGKFEDKALENEVRKAGITASGAEGIAQLQRSVKEFYARLIQSGSLPATILGDPVQLDLLRIVSNFDGSKWRRAIVFEELIKDFLASNAAPLSPQFYDPSGSLRQGKIAVRRLRADFKFEEPAKLMYAKVLNEIRQGLALARMDDGARRKKVEKEIFDAIDAELEEIRQGREATDNEKAKIGLDQRKERLEALREAILKEGANLTACLAEYLAEYDKKGKHPLGPYLRTLLFSESFKINNTYAEIFKDVFASESSGAISTTNVGNVLEFLGNVVKQHVLAEDGHDPAASLPVDIKVKGNIKNRYLQVKALSDDYLRATKDANDLDKNILTVVPTRGILGELSGYFCDACWTQQYNIMKNNPDMVAFYFVENAGDPLNARIVGGSLLLLTKSGGKEAFVIRGLNPQDKIADNFSSEDLIGGFMKYLDTIPMASGERTYLIPSPSSGALSNRPAVTRAFSSTVDLKELLSLDIPNRFNGYDITKNVHAIKRRPAVVPVSVPAEVVVAEVPRADVIAAGARSEVRSAAKGEAAGKLASLQEKYGDPWFKEAQLGAKISQLIEDLVDLADETGRPQIGKFKFLSFEVKPGADPRELEQLYQKRNWIGWAIKDKPWQKISENPSAMAQYENSNRNGEYFKVIQASEGEDVKDFVTRLVEKAKEDKKIVFGTYNFAIVEAGPDAKVEELAAEIVLRVAIRAALDHGPAADDEFGKAFWAFWNDRASGEKRDALAQQILNITGLPMGPELAPWMIRAIFDEHHPHHLPKWVASYISLRDLFSAIAQQSAARSEARTSGARSDARVDAETAKGNWTSLQADDGAEYFSLDVGRDLPTPGAKEKKGVESITAFYETHGTIIPRMVSDPRDLKEEINPLSAQVKQLILWLAMPGNLGIDAVLAGFNSDGDRKIEFRMAVENMVGAEKALLALMALGPEARNFLKKTFAREPGDLGRLLNRIRDNGVPERFMAAVEEFASPDMFGPEAFWRAFRGNAEDFAIAISFAVSGGAPFFRLLQRFLNHSPLIRSRMLQALSQDPENLFNVLHYCSAMKQSDQDRLFRYLNKEGSVDLARLIKDTGTSLVVGKQSEEEEESDYSTEDAVYATGKVAEWLGISGEVELSDDPGKPSRRKVVLHWDHAPIEVQRSVVHLSYAFFFGEMAGDLSAALRKMKPAFRSAAVFNGSLFLAAAILASNSGRLEDFEAIGDAGAAGDQAPLLSQRAQRLAEAVTADPSLQIKLPKTLAFLAEKRARAEKTEIKGPEPVIGVSDQVLGVAVRAKVDGREVLVINPKVAKRFGKGEIQPGQEVLDFLADVYLASRGVKISGQVAGEEMQKPVFTFGREAEQPQGLPTTASSALKWMLKHVKDSAIFDREYFRRRLAPLLVDAKFDRAYGGVCVLSDQIFQELLMRFGDGGSAVAANLFGISFIPEDIFSGALDGNKDARVSLDHEQRHTQFKIAHGWESSDDVEFEMIDELYAWLRSHAEIYGAKNVTAGGEVTLAKVVGKVLTDLYVRTTVDGDGLVVLRKGKELPAKIRAAALALSRRLATCKTRDALDSVFDYLLQEQVKTLDAVIAMDPKADPSALTEQFREFLSQRRAFVAARGPRVEIKKPVAPAKVAAVQRDVLSREDRGRLIDRLSRMHKTTLAIVKSKLGEKVAANLERKVSPGKFHDGHRFKGDTPNPQYYFSTVDGIEPDDGGHPAETQVYRANDVLSFALFAHVPYKNDRRRGSNELKQYLTAVKNFAPKGARRSELRAGQAKAGGVFDRSEEDFDFETMRRERAGAPKASFAKKLLRGAMILGPVLLITQAAFAYYWGQDATRSYDAKEYKIMVVNGTENIKAFKEAGGIYVSNANPFQPTENGDASTGWVRTQGADVNAFNPNSRGWAMAKGIFLKHRNGRVVILPASEVDPSALSSSVWPDGFQAGPMVVAGGILNPNLESWYEGMLAGRKVIVGADRQGRMHVLDLFGPDVFGQLGLTQARFMRIVRKWAQTNNIVGALAADGGNTGIRLTLETPPTALFAFPQKSVSPAPVVVLAQKAPRSEVRARVEWKPSDRIQQPHYVSRGSVAGSVGRAVLGVMVTAMSAFGEPAGIGKLDSAAQGQRAVRYELSVQHAPRYAPWSEANSLKQVAPFLGLMQQFNNTWARTKEVSALPGLHRSFFEKLQSELKSRGALLLADRPIPQDTAAPDYARLFHQLVLGDLANYFAQNGLVVNFQRSAIQSIERTLTIGGQTTRSSYVLPVYQMPEQYYVVVESNPSFVANYVPDMKERPFSVVLVQPVEITMTGDRILFKMVQETFDKHGECGFADGTTAFIRADLAESMIRQSLEKLQAVGSSLLLDPSISYKEALQGVKFRDPNDPRASTMRSYPAFNLTAAAGFSGVRFMLWMGMKGDRLDGDLYREKMLAGVAAHELGHVGMAHGSRVERVVSVIAERREDAQNIGVSAADADKALTLSELHARLESFRKTPLAYLEALMGSAGHFDVLEKENPAYWAAEREIYDGIMAIVKEDPAPYGIHLDPAGTTMIVMAGTKGEKQVEVPPVEVQIAGQLAEAGREGVRVTRLYKEVSKRIGLPARMQELGDRYSHLDPQSEAPSKPSAPSLPEGKNKRSELRIAEEEKLKEVAAPLAIALKPDVLSNNRRPLDSKTAREAEAYVVRGERDALIRAMKQAVEEQMAEALSKGSVPVTPAGVSASQMVERIRGHQARLFKTLKTLPAKGVISVGFMMDPKNSRPFLEQFVKALQGVPGVTVEVIASPQLLNDPVFKVGQGVQKRPIRGAAFRLGNMVTAGANAEVPLATDPVAKSEAGPLADMFRVLSMDFTGIEENDTLIRYELYLALGVALLKMAQLGTTPAYRNLTSAAEKAAYLKTQLEKEEAFTGMFRVDADGSLSLVGSLVRDFIAASETQKAA
jgi:hypothetical protein